MVAGEGTGVYVLLGRAQQSPLGCCCQGFVVTCVQLLKAEAMQVLVWCERGSWGLRTCLVKPRPFQAQEGSSQHLRHRQERTLEPDAAVLCLFLASCHGCRLGVSSYVLGQDRMSAREVLTS